MDELSNKLLTKEEWNAHLQADLDRMTDSDFLTADEREELLTLLETFFERWEELHRVIPSGDRAQMEAAAVALTWQANKVRAFYG